MSRRVRVCAAYGHRQEGHSGGELLRASGYPLAGGPTAVRAGSLYPVEDIEGNVARCVDLNSVVLRWQTSFLCYKQTTTTRVALEKNVRFFRLNIYMQTKGYGADESTKKKFGPTMACFGCTKKKKPDIYMILRTKSLSIYTAVYRLLIWSCLYYHMSFFSIIYY